jgi:6-phosphogluconate dehydrogenase
VVQDIDGSEGTGIWSNTEAVDLHVSAPSLSTAHFLRIASAFRGNREHVQKVFHSSFLPENIEFKNDEEKETFIEDLRQAVYATCLASYVQGMNIIFEADNQNRWDINYSNVVQIWKAGCIIQSDHISSLLYDIFVSKSFTSENDHSLLYHSTVADELKATFDSLKKVVVRGTLGNAVIPSLSATLEYLKYEGNVDLPTQFYEAELDYFGKHMYDSKKMDTDPGPPETGKRHYEWKPA